MLPLAGCTTKRSKRTAPDMTAKWQCGSRLDVISNVAVSHANSGPCRPTICKNIPDSQTARQRNFGGWLDWSHNLKSNPYSLPSSLSVLCRVGQLLFFAINRYGGA